MDPLRGPDMECIQTLKYIKLIMLNKLCDKINFNRGLKIIKENKNGNFTTEKYKM